MKLMKFRIENFRSIIDTECYVDNNLTILAGQNECGKSNILKALTKLTDRKFNDEDIPVGNDEAETRITYMFELSERDKQTLREKLELTEFEIKEFTVFVDKEGLSFVWNTEQIDLILKAKVASIFSAYLAKEQSSKIKISGSLSEWLDEKEEVISELNSEDKDKYIASISEAKKFLSDFYEKLQNQIIEMLPNIILYDSLTDTIPDSFKKGDLKNKGIQNLSYYLDYDFDEVFNEVSSQKRVSKCKQISRRVSDDFCSRYHQNKVQISFNFDAQEIYIYVHDIVNGQEGEPIKISQRSKGFAWYLGFYIALNGVDNKEGDIVLIDEPGLYLHPKAQEDMRAVLESLEQYQIIYTTHSPYLINTDNLHRIRLVERNPEGDNDTIIRERIHAYNTEDTLKPIVDAIGYSVGSELNLNIEKILILEGVSDYYYLKAIEKLLDKELDCNVTYAKSADKIEYMISLYFGLGIKNLYVLVDSDKKGINIAKEILKNSILDETRVFYTHKETDKEKCIEDIFDHDLFCEKILEMDDSNPKFKNALSKMETKNGKFISAKKMHGLVNSGDIDETILGEEARELFTRLEEEIGLK